MNKTKFLSAELMAFMVVARERSFTRAAAQLGISQSRLSQTIREFEEKLSVRLLNRSTRSVYPSDAGLQLFEAMLPLIDSMEQEISNICDYGKRPAGIVKISATEDSIGILWPFLQGLLRDNPDIQIEVMIDYKLTNLIESGIDAGIRYGDSITEGMISIPLKREIRTAVVASPDYFKHFSMPQTPNDLLNHRCINIRLPTYGGLYAWEFEKDGKKLNVHVGGQIIVASATATLTAALAGLGIAYLPEHKVIDQINEGKLIRLLEQWCPPYPGYYLYYPSKKQQKPALAAVIKSILDSKRF